MKKGFFLGILGAALAAPFFLTSSAPKFLTSVQLESLRLKNQGKLTNGRLSAAFAGALNATRDFEETLDAGDKAQAIRAQSVLRTFLANI